MVTLVRVFVATTEGASEIQHIIEEDPEVRSVICLNGTSEALPVSRDYDSFVRKPTGVVERLFGHPSYRVDVSRRISNGQSWQLGLMVAHALYAQGRLATKDGPADEVYWVTGEVRHNLDVMPVDHVREKLRQSEALFDGLAHLPTNVTVLVPRGNVGEAEVEIRALGLAVNLEGIDCWDKFGMSGGVPEPAAKGGRPWRRLVLISFALLLPISAAALLGPWWKSDVPKAIGIPLQPPLPPAPIASPPPAPEAAKLAEATPPPSHVMPQSAEPPAATAAAKAPEVAPAKPLPTPPPPLLVTAVERRAPSGTGCGRLRLTGGSTVDTEITATAEGFSSRTAIGLCEVEFRATNPSAESRFIGMNLDTTIEGSAPLFASDTVPPGGIVSLKVMPKAWDGGKAWRATLIVSDAPGSPDQRMFTEPPATYIKSKTLIYIADAPAEPRFK